MKTLYSIKSEYSKRWRMGWSKCYVKNNKDEDNSVKTIWKVELKKWNCFQWTSWKLNITEDNCVLIIIIIIIINNWMKIIVWITEGTEPGQHLDWGPLRNNWYCK